MQNSRRQIPNKFEASSFKHLDACGLRFWYCLGFVIWSLLRMKIIVGLGNPGRKYERTRHNAGFMAADELARRHQIGITREKAGCLIGTGNIGSGNVILAKPQTFMNESGRGGAAPPRDWY